MDKHVIIVGSGLGGLACGYILAKNGYRVSIFEKNAQPGGCLQTFTRGGVKFETGMHYIGSIEKGQLLHRLFDYLSILPDVVLRSLDKSAYDVISIGGERYPYANGEENFIESLTRRFPDEGQNLRRYFRAIREVAENSPIHSLRTTDEVILLNPEHVKRSASDFFEQITKNVTLQRVLAGNVPLYAGVKNKTPMYIPAFINGFYNESAYRIVGGSDVVARSLVHSIRSMGGELYTSSSVKRIRCNESRAVSVTLHDGQEAEGDYFISDIHPLRLLELLPDTALLRKSYRERIAALDNTIANFTVYIRFKKDKVPYYNSNLYHYDTPEDVWRGGDYDPNTWPNGFLYMHLCSSETQEYADAAILIGYMNYDEVSTWENLPVNRRGEAYEAFKHEKAESLLALLERQMPGTRSQIERYYTSSPLTYRDYTGTERGAMYGILPDCTSSRHSLVSQRTRIPNLLQTGQNVNSHGILGVIIGAMITSGELLGINTILKQIKP